ncbi:hypothetical protein GQ457_07G008780 [Hibiscus cannabinus]
MSDRQNIFLVGLKEALDELFPNSEQRNCIRHIYINFKRKETNRGKASKDVLWKAARSTYVTQFTTAMNEMKAISKDAHDWFVDKAPSMWSKSHFSTRSKCDMLLNKLSECFNKIIVEARDKPILTMLEIIRTKMIRRIVQRREEAEKYIGILCPKIQKKLDNQIQNSVRYRPIYAGNFQYQVECGQWEQHVLEDKKKEKIRKRHVSKKGSKMTYTKYDKTGHNIRTCKGKIGGNKYLKNMSKETFKEKVANKNKTKINPPTTSKPTFYRGELISSKPTFYRPKPTSFGYDSKVDDVHTRKFCLQPTSTSL